MSNRWSVRVAISFLINYNNSLSTQKSQIRQILIVNLRMPRRRSQARRARPKAVSLGLCESFRARRRPCCAVGGRGGQDLGSSRSRSPLMIGLGFFWAPSSAKNRVHRAWQRPAGLPTDWVPWPRPLATSLEHSGSLDLPSLGAAFAASSWHFLHLDLTNSWFFCRSQYRLATRAAPTSAKARPPNRFSALAWGPGLGLLPKWGSGTFSASCTSRRTAGMEFSNNPLSILMDFEEVRAAEPFDYLLVSVDSDHATATVPSRVQWPRASCANALVPFQCPSSPLSLSPLFFFDLFLAILLSF